MSEFHPDVLDVMATVGVTFDQFRAIYRAAWSLATGQTLTALPQSLERRPTSPDAIDPAIARLIARDEAKRLRDRQYSAGRRAAKSADAAPASADSRPTSPDAPLSLSKSLDSDPKDLTEREKAKPIGRRGPLSADWQPDAETAKLASDRLGEGAGCCLAKFRDHHAGGEEQHTPKGWQGQARKWIRNERMVGPQRSLPLVAPVPPAARPPVPVDPAFAPVLRRLEAMLGAEVTRSWFGDARIEIDNDTAIVTLPTRMVCHRVEGNYAGQLERALAAEFRVRHVRLIAATASGNLPTVPSRATGPPLAGTG